RVHPTNVVVIVVLVAPNEAAALVAITSDGLEGNGQFDVLVVRVLRDTDVEHSARTLGGLGQHIAALGRRGCIRHDLPYTPFPLACFIRLPTPGDFAEVVLAESEGAHLGFA